MSSSPSSDPEPVAAATCHPNLADRPILRQAIAHLPTAELNPSFKPLYKPWQGESCSLCLQEYQTDQTIIETVTLVPCGHFYHTECLTEMIVGMPGVSKCAECRATIFTAEQHESISRERARNSSRARSSTLFGGIYEPEDILDHIYDHLEDVIDGPWGAAVRNLDRNLHRNLEFTLNDFSDLLWGILNSFRAWMDEVFDAEHHSIEMAILYLVNEQFREVFDGSMHSFLNEIAARHHIPPQQLIRFNELLQEMSVRPSFRLIANIDPSRPAGAYSVMLREHPDMYAVVLRPFEVLVRMNLRLNALLPVYNGLPDNSDARDELREIFYHIVDAIEAFVAWVQPVQQGPERALRDRRTIISIGERELVREAEGIYRNLIAFFLRTEREFDVEPPASFPENFLNFIVRDQNEQTPANWVQVIVNGMAEYLARHRQLARPPWHASQSRMFVESWQWRNRGVLQDLNYHPQPINVTSASR